MSDRELEQGTLIAGRYRLDRHLGEGGMGTVWSATHAVTRREVALKLLRPELHNRSDLRKRFLDEARAASALDHPNVIDVLDVFELDDSTPVIVMELLDGQTLGQRLERDPRLSLEETAAIMVPVLEAVAKAHSLGVVHRDLKPENIFLTRRSDAGWVKVLDFGIAKLSAEHYAGQSQSPAVTRQGSVLGTPRYMAPEQLSNEGVDQRADVWSLGAIVYECLSGTRAIEGDHVAEVVGRLLAGVIVPLAELTPELPAELTSTVQRMLTRDPARRLCDITLIVEALRRYRLSEPAAASARRSRPSIAAHAPAALTSAGTLAAGVSRATGVAPPPARRRRTLWIWALVAVCSISSALIVQFVVAGARHSPPRVEAADSVYAPPEPTMQAPPRARLVKEEPLTVAPPELSVPPVPASGERPIETARKRRRRSSHKSAPSAHSSVKSADPSEQSLFSGRK